MSADDCIAILPTKIYPHAKRYQEYRVIWAQCIENVYISDEYLVNYFKNAPVFDTYQGAVNYAHHLEETHGPTECGIIIVGPEADKTWDELILNKNYNRGNDDNAIH